MAFREKKYWDNELSLPKTLKKKTLSSFLLFTMAMCFGWIILGIFLIDTYPLLFPVVPFFYLIPAYLLNEKGKTAISWHITLISASIYFLLFPVFFESIPLLVLLLIVLYQLVSLAFHQAKIITFYTLLLGLSMFTFLYLTYSPTSKTSESPSLFTNISIAFAAFFFLTFINYIKGREARKFKNISLENKKQLLQKEEKYRALFESSPAGIVIVDIEKRITLDCNEQMLHIFGASKDEIIHGGSLDFSPEYQPDGQLSREKYAALLQEYQKNREPFNHYWQYLSKKGRVIDTEVSLRPINLGSKNLAVMQIQDITAKNAAEQERIKHEIKYRTLFENGFDGIAIFDSYQLKPVNCNQVVLDVLGLSFEEFKNFELLNLAPEFQPSGQSSRSFIKENLEKLKKKKKNQFEWFQYDIHGRGYYVEVSAFALPAPEENSIFVIFKDITNKVITQRALEAVSKPISGGNEQLFYDELTQEIAKFLQVNIALIGKLSDDKKTMFAKGLWYRDQNIHGLSYTLSDTPCEQVVITNEVRCYPSEIKSIFPRDKDLELWEVESYLAYPLFNADNEIIGHLAVMDNKPFLNEDNIHTTLQIFRNSLASELQREDYQQQLVQRNDELKKVNSELDRFVYSAAHDIRAPISSVLGLINISEEQEDLSIIKHYLKLQKSSLKKLDLFITDLINYSINKRRNVVHEPVNVYELVEEVIDQYRYLDNFDRVQIHKNMQVKSVLFSDQNRLKLILNNLISNAITYADLTKEEPQINITIDITENKALFEVWDNGQGIHQDHIKKIFEMFHRANKYSKGSGIGLYITEEAVEKLGGKIVVDSVYQEWTSFSFEIKNQLQAKESLERSN